MAVGVFKMYEDEMNEVHQLGIGLNQNAYGLVGFDQAAHDG